MTKTDTLQKEQLMFILFIISPDINLVKMIKYSTEVAMMKPTDLTIALFWEYPTF